MARPIVICKLCGKEKVECARGLCNACYKQARKQAMKDGCYSPETAAIFIDRAAKVFSSEYSPETLAYAAGLIDGEGCITISRNARKNKKKDGTSQCVSYSLAVVVQMTDVGPVEFMHAQFGGWFKPYHYKKENRQVYHWGLRTAQAGRFLELILPYLKAKEEQALLGVYYAERQEGVKIAGRKGHDEKFKRFQRQIYGAMKRAKKEKG